MTAVSVQTIISVALILGLTAFMARMLAGHRWQLLAALRYDAFTPAPGGRPGVSTAAAWRPALAA